MSFLLTFTYASDDGTVEHEETVICDLPALDAIEKRVRVPAGWGTLRITFDPPLVQREDD